VNADRSLVLLVSSWVLAPQLPCACLGRTSALRREQLFQSTLRGHKPRELQEYVFGRGPVFVHADLQGAAPRLPHPAAHVIVSGCSKPIPFLGLSARGREQNGSCWRVVHFNCMGHKGKRKGRYDVPGEWKRRPGGPLA